MIELRNISKSFNVGTANESKALDHINLLLQEGDFVTIIGGNGAGKSTLMNIISGSISPDEGQVLLNNNDVTKMKEHQRAPYFGRVFQDPMVGTASDMTVIENLALAYGRGKSRSLFRWSYRKSDVNKFIDDLKILDLNLDKRLYQKVGLLSGGQRQALTLLMATIRNKPSLRRLKKDYVRFYDGDKKEAKRIINEAFIAANKIRKQALIDLNKSALSKSERRERLKKIKQEYEKTLRVYDVTKPVLLLDEHTAALDPKTASKVLDITERIINDNFLTTIMITHNMKDAIRYGNRLIMLSQGKIVVDISGEEKSKLTIEQLLNMFVSNTQNDMLSDSAILG